ncbi:MAG: mannose-1-phosphate guanylyltransferase, partial [Candidatus Binatia bacterium]
YAVIMAGGSGERFWPLSTPDRPKQFLRLLGEKSLLRSTVDRIEPLIPIDRQIVVAGEQHTTRVEEELPDLPPANLICEPVGRNTAACIGLASLFIERRDPGAILVVLPADHHIPEASAFLASIEKAVQVARQRDETVVVGLRPDRPETGYGYIQSGPEIERHVHRVLQFREKPDEERARQYLEAGDYFWNTGIFVWQNRTFQQLIKTHLPTHWSKLERIRAAIDSSEYMKILKECYPTIEKVSVDYGVLEKAENISMVYGRFEWDDLGSWTSLDRVLSRDEEENVVIGRHVGLHTSNCIIYGEGKKAVATIGLRDLIIAETEHGLLICPKNRSQDIRSLFAAVFTHPVEGERRIETQLPPARKGRKK